MICRAQASERPREKQVMTKTTNHKGALLITVTGKDQPGISARMAACLHQARAELLRSSRWSSMAD